MIYFSRCNIHVATGRQSTVGSCNPLVNLVPLRACEWGHGTCVLHSHSFQGPPESTTQKGTFLKSAIVMKVAALAVVAGLAGCQDLKPLQADVADLKSQVAKLQSDVAAAKSSADQANSTAQAANQAASSAQSTANQALAAAQASQSAVDATNEKIDRMFKRSISK
jgi:murein lipoprotein